MTETPPPRPAVADAELAGNMATIKRGVETKVAEIKRDLAQWLDETRDPSESAPVSIALLETACDRYLDTHDEQDARDRIERAFHRALRKRRGNRTLPLKCPCVVWAKRDGSGCDQIGPRCAPSGAHNE